MGYRCAIQTCRNSNSKTRTNDKTVKYFAFPRNPEIRVKWVNSCLRTDDFLPENSYVCSEHFSESDYERDLKAELMNLPPKRILKPETVPSLSILKAAKVTEDLSSIARKRKTQETLNIGQENKENLGKTDTNGPSNGFIISYLGVPRLLITSNSKSTDDSKNPGDSSSSRIISVDPEYGSDITSTVDNHEQGFGQMENLNESLPNKNVFKLDELCRLCGCYSNRMKAIFENNSQINYSEIISIHFPDIKIQKNDILPVKICARCETNLVSWYQFHKTCNAVNKRFQSILKKLSAIPVTPVILPKESILKNKPNKSSDETMETHYNNNDDCDMIYEDDSIREIEIVEISPEVVETDTVDVFPEEKIDVSGSAVIHEDVVEEKIGIDEHLEPVGKYNMADVKFEDIPCKEEIKDLETNDDKKLSSSPRLKMKSREILQGNARRRRRRRIPTLNLRRMCHICGKIFKYPESLRRHLKTVHSDERPFKCHLCTSSFNRNHNLTIHIKVVHQHQRVYVKKHVQRLCDYCGKVLLSARSLEEHISSIHTKKALYECDKCHSTFYRKLSYDKHRTSDECDSENPKKCNAPKTEEVFLKYCEFCGLEFKKEHFYTKHKLKHMNSFVCSVCSVNFEDGTLLKEHIDSEHPEMKPFECEVCGKKFKNKPLLNCHLIIHTGEKRYQCQYCSLKFLKKKYLSTHILTHTGERPFVCTICGKGFKQSGDMRKHKATHIRRQI